MEELRGVAPRQNPFPQEPSVISQSEIRSKSSWERRQHVRSPSGLATTTSHSQVYPPDTASADTNLTQLHGDMFRMLANLSSSAPHSQ